MAKLEITFRPKSLNFNTTVSVILPTMKMRDMSSGQRFETYYENMKPYPVLWLFHGTYGDHSDWLRFTSVERYAVTHKLAIVAPAVALSSYTDMAHGPAYYTYVSQELPAYLSKFLPLRIDRAGNFTAGLSMGGYGALKVALKNPERYAAVISMSGGVDRAALVDAARRQGPDDHSVHNAKALADVFGDLDAVRGGDEDLFGIVPRLAQSALPKPSIFQSCGGNDPMALEPNRRFYDLLTRNDFDVLYEEVPGYAHEWDFWDLMIRRGINWLSESGLID